MTNGEKIKEIFPDIEFTDMAFTVHAVTEVILDGVKGHISYDFWKYWWNAEYKEPTTKNEAKYCDRNICLKNEYNGIGCEDCEVTKSQEPTTKNDLGVDTDKLIADCEKMSFDFELFGRPTKALLLDAVKNIVKHLPSVTPQEPRWIPVSERLPEEWKSVLVCYKSQGGVAQCVSERLVNMDGSSRWSALCGQEPIAWMPLPQAYSEAEE